MAQVTAVLRATKYAYIEEANPNQHFAVNTGNTYTLNGFRNTFTQKMLALKFEAPPAAAKHAYLYGVQLTLQYQGTSGSTSSTGAIQPRILASQYEDFDENAVTWNDLTDKSPDFTIDMAAMASVSGFQDNTSPATGDMQATRDYQLRILEGGLKVIFIVNSNFSYYNGADSRASKVKLKLSDNSAPYLTVHYSDSYKAASMIAYKSGPSGGAYADPREAITFAWKLAKASSMVTISDDFAQTSATFSWKLSTDNTWTDVAISGNTQEVTIPANTFPVASTIDWKVSAVDEDNQTKTLSTRSFSTADGTAYATCVSPVNVVAEGDKPITFTWTLENDSGSAATRVEAEWKTPDDVNWTSLFDLNENATSWEAPANTFSPGEVQWRVRAYNRDAVAGPWSAPDTGWFSFICLAAPDPPVGLQTNGKPFLTLTWQAAGQQAFRIYADGKLVADEFGDAKTWTLDEPLPDGEHEISVSVQGTYGLWSNLSAITVTIENAPGDPVTLSGTFAIDAALSWATTEAGGSFYVLRDGVRIGHTEATEFIDYLSLGEHNYQIMQRLTSDDYTLSNRVTGTTAVEEPQISLLTEPGWLALPLSEEDVRVVQYNYTRTHEMRHVMGSRWPVLELSPFEDESVRIACAFKDARDVWRFELLRGQPVVLKLKNGDVIIGPLANIQKRVSVFYTAYSFTIQRMHTEDLVT